MNSTYMYRIITIMVCMVFGLAAQISAEKNYPGPSPYQDPVDELRDKYAESLAIWDALNEEHCGTYHYTYRQASVFGFGSETTVQVIENEVVSRSYREFHLDGSHRDSVIDEQWTEKEDQIGSHNQGFPALRMEEIYQRCRSILYRDIRQDLISFEPFPNGLVRFCTYTPIGCMDDCSRGIKLSNIAFGIAETPFSEN